MKGRCQNEALRFRTDSVDLEEKNDHVGHFIQKPFEGFFSYFAIMDTSELHAILNRTDSWNELTPRNVD